MEMRRLVASSAGAHDDDDALGVGCAGVVEEVIGAAGELGEAVHRVLHDGGAGEVEGVTGFAGLEEDVGVLGGATKDGMVGAESAFAVSEDELLVEHAEDGFV